MKILIVDDEPNIRESLGKYLALEGMETITAGDGSSAQVALAGECVDAIVLDLKLPGMSGHEVLAWLGEEGIRAPVIMISAHGEIADAVSALKHGASDYLTKPFDPDELVHRLRALVARSKSDDLVEAIMRTGSGEQRLVGHSHAMQNISRIVACVAPSPSTVLITGESGTGKEVVAREIHAISPRSAEPFVAVNIGGIHQELMESELFGHEKGAFTGASSRKIGLFELAGSGTLFLDEIGEMPANLQVKLLRVIQERKIRRLGSNVDLPVNARIISATNRDIEAMVHDGKFREDLYYRLNVVRIGMPPLRERAEDIPLIANHLIAKLAARMNRKPCVLSETALGALAMYRFPGNVRELENILERALIYCGGRVIQRADLDLHGAMMDSPESDSPQAAVFGLAGGVSLDETERHVITAALERHKGNRTHAAAELGISRRTIINKIKQYS